VDGLRLKSEKNWQVGCLCLEHGYIDAAANRLYYAVFQAVLLSVKAKQVSNTIAVRDNDTSSKHTIMRRAVGAEGIGRRNASRQFGRLQSLRETADYDPEPVQEEELRGLISYAQGIKRFWLQRTDG